jgi:hypothetical protein
VRDLTASARRGPRAWRINSVTIDGAATELNGTPPSGSKRSIGTEQANHRQMHQIVKRFGALSVSIGELARFQ